MKAVFFKTDFFQIYGFFLYDVFMLFGEVANFAEPLGFKLHIAIFETPKITFNNFRGRFRIYEKGN